MSLGLSSIDHFSIIFQHIWTIGPRP